LIDFGGIVITTSHYNKILENQELQGQNCVYHNINYFNMAMTNFGKGYNIEIVEFVQI
jgi:hypothetical protein